MTKFTERLQQAAKYAGVGDTQAEIAADLGLQRQVVNHWFNKGGSPQAETLALIGKRWGINGEWLRSGDGEMLPQPSPDGLQAEERELVRYYRSATPNIRLVISRMVRAVRKSVVTIAAVIPPFMAPQPSDAAILHKLFCDFHLTEYALHAVRRWLQRLLGSSALVLAAACATPAPDQVTVRWVRVSQDEIHRVCASAQGHNPTVIGRNRACAHFNRDGGFCTIYATDYTERLGMESASDRRERELMASLGHELKHCFDGHWH